MVAAVLIQPDRKVVIPLFARGELKLEGEWSWLQDPTEFNLWLKPLEQQTCVAFIEPPPNENAKAEHVLKYLARYMTGGPISDRRLISHENGDVTFWARTGEKTNAKEMSPSVPFTLSGVEFTRRWSLHILPKGYVKSRCYDGYHNRNRATYLAQCHELLGTVNGTPPSSANIFSHTPEEPSEQDPAG